jgi:glucose-6-phosphate 1-epimerase
MQTLSLKRGAERALISLHGGQLLSWYSAGRERLFLSPHAVLDGSAAIRGGVPVIFPQFNARGPYGRHGFARNSRWSPVAQAEDRVELELSDSVDSLRLWPHRFRARLQVQLQTNALDMQLRIENRGAQSFEFSAALHAYFAVQMATTRITGLAHAAYEETACLHPASAAEPLHPEPPLDRIYAGGDDQLQLHDGQHGLRLQRSGFEDWVIWNPGAEAAAALPDLGAAAAADFVCIEPGCILRPPTLAPGQGFSGSLRMTAVD